jgi:glycosyltransferase involved in cell wall biosynthesis
VSLLLPVYNAELVLDLVLERLAANTTYANVELIAVDDGSTDASLEILRRWRDSGRFGRFELIEKENGGAIDTLNTALDAAKGQVCVQLDADASLETRGWLEKMLTLLQTDDRVGAVGAKIVIDSGYLHACGVDLVGPQGHRDRGTRTRERTGKRTWHYKIQRLKEGAFPEESRATEVDAAIGCCLMYRRVDAVKAGGYDRGYSPVWFDDLDLCLGIRRGGRKVFYLPDVRVIHHVQGRAVPRPRTRGLKGLIKRVTPHEARMRLRARFTPGAFFSDAQRERMVNHYAYWRRKWGWDMLNPNVQEIERRWGGTEITWRLNPEKRRAGEDILSAYEARNGGG